MVITKEMVDSIQAKKAEDVRMARIKREKAAAMIRILESYTNKPGFLMGLSVATD